MKTILCRIRYSDREEIQLCELVIINGRPHARFGTDQWELNPMQITEAIETPGIDCTYQESLVPRRSSH